MKKILFATTALIAFGATAAQAAEPIKLQLGGYSKWWVGYASQDDSFERATGDRTAVDVQGDNEVFFKGSTTLDNGIKIGIDVQLEAGGSTSDTTDSIDESYVTVDGGFGRVILGTENNGAYLLHVSAPDAASNLDEGGLIEGQWVVRPGQVGVLSTTAILTGGDSEKITYVSPSFAGFTVGASYIPDGGTEDDRGVTNNSTTTNAAGNATVNINEAYGAGAAYNNTFGGVGVKASVGYVVGDVNSNTTATTSAYTSDEEWSAGAQLSYAGFTLGGSYRSQELEGKRGTSDQEGKVWNVGLQYATGPFAVSLAYMQSNIEYGRGVTDDDMTLYQLSGKYNMGPGVDMLATIGHIEFDNNNAVAAQNNEGWAAMTALSLAF